MARSVKEMFEEELAAEANPRDLKALKVLIGFIVRNTIPGATLGQVQTLRNNSGGGDPQPDDYHRIGRKIRQVVTGEMSRKLKLDDDGGADEIIPIRDAAE